MFPARFEYADPTSIDEVIALLAKHGSEAKLLAGGQTLVAAMNLGLLQPGIVVDLNRVAGLDHLERRAGELVLGGLVRHHRLEHAAEVAATCPLLAEAATLIGNPR